MWGLNSKLYFVVSPYRCSLVCGQDPERRQARRSAGAAADEVRADNQFEKANQIALMIPQWVLMKADRVIK